MKTSLLKLCILGFLPFSTKLVVEANTVHPAADHDLCQNARVLSLGEIATSNLFSATTDVSNSLPKTGHNAKFDRGVWFRVIGNGGMLKASTCVDTTLVYAIFAIFYGECDNLTFYKWSSGWDGGKVSNICSSQNFQTEVNKEYWILVDEASETRDDEAGQIGMTLTLGDAGEGGGIFLSEGSQHLFCNGPKARAWGDPHIVTFDDYSYDCQGVGDFVLAKSPSTSFEIQGRYQTSKWFKGASVMKGVSLMVEEGVPKIEVRVDPSITATSCEFDIYADGEKVDGTSSLYNGDIMVTEKGGSLIIFYVQSNVRIELVKKHSKSFGCYLNIQVCLSESFNDVVGLLGSPDGDETNDWMSRDGATVYDLPSGNEGRFSQSYDYCVTNWCVQNEAASLFEYYEDGETFEDYYSCNTPYDSGGETAFNNLSEEDLELCSGNIPLCVELAIGGLDSVEEAVEVIRELDDVKNIPYTGNFDDIVMEDESGNAVVNSYVDPTTTPESPNVAYVPESPIGAYGDPHITLWTGKHYDFHGACDLVLLKNPSFQDGMGLTIHIRTKFTKQWSFIESAVIRLGSDTLELKGSSKKETLYWINGELGGDLGQGIAGYPVELKKINSYHKELVLRLNGKEEIALRTFKELVRVDISSPTVQSFGSSEGLLGRFPTGERLGRDRETEIEDCNTFGQEWQVLTDEDMLFHAVDGVQAPKICPLPDASSKTIRRRRLNISSITEKEAKVACARVDPNFFDSCVFDVLAINDKDVAGSY